MSQSDIPTPREPIADPQGYPTRVYWRFLNGLMRQSGTLASALVVKGNALLTGTSILSGGTIESPDLPGSSLVGNPSTTAGQPATVGLDSTLAFVNAGSIGTAKVPGQTIMGNAGANEAQAVPLNIGGDLFFVNGNTLYAAPGQSAPVNAATAIYGAMGPWGRTADLERRVQDALTIGILGL